MTWQFAREADPHLTIEYFACGQPNSLRSSRSGRGFCDAALAAANVTGRKPVDAGTARAIAAMPVGYSAILCSPEFLFLREQDGPLDVHALAGRLSDSIRQRGSNRAIPGRRGVSL